MMNKLIVGLLASVAAVLAVLVGYLMLSSGGGGDPDAGKMTKKEHEEQNKTVAEPGQEIKREELPKPPPDKKKEVPKPAAAAAPAPSWKRVCSTTDVDVDGMKEFAVDGTGVLIVRTADACFAYQAMCPHEAIPLEAGVCDGSVVACLEHLWQFDVRTGAPLGDAEKGLTAFPIKEEEGEVYVKLAR